MWNNKSSLYLEIVASYLKNLNRTGSHQNSELKTYLNNIGCLN